jgi:hypothetical protein
MEKTSFSSKKFAASCLNNLKHGSTSTSLFIQDEQPSDYLALLDSAFEQFQPFSDHDASIVARCVHDNWILLRRERAADTAEASLYLRRPDPSEWTEQDMASMTRFSRYKTEAARAYERSLHCLKAIKKLLSDGERWQFHLDAEKQKLAIHIERFEIWKERNVMPSLEDLEDLPDDIANPPEPEPPPPAKEEKSVSQTLFIGAENGESIIYETTPSNDALHHSITPNTKIVRTYNFVGSVPPDYQHLLTTDAHTFGKSTCIHKTYSFAEWKILTESEC